MKILVTGGAGFIGSHIVEQALEAGHQLSVLDNLSTGKRENVPDEVMLYEVDLRDREGTLAVLRDFEPDIVSHQAAQASVSVSVREPALDANINILGGIHLLDACTATSVKRVVFASTGGAIYGEVAAPGKADEGTQPMPYSPYAISKLTVENLLKFYRAERGLEFTILRYANIYGPRQDAFGEAGVVAIFSERTLAGQPVQINARRTPGDGGCIRDYTYVADVARANLLAADGRLEHDTMNVGTGVETTTSQLAEQIQAVTGQRVEVTQADRRAGDLERSVLDASRSKAALGEPTPLAAGLERTLGWYRSQRH